MNVQHSYRLQKVLNKLQWGCVRKKNASHVVHLILFRKQESQVFFIQFYYVDDKSLWA